MADDTLPKEQGLLTRFGSWLHRDPLKLRRWTRSFMAWVGAMGMMVIAPGMDSAMNWTVKEWTKRLSVAAIFGFVGAINLGDKNVPTEK